MLTQAQMLIVLRTIAPQDLAAMRAWIEVHGTLEQGKTMMDSLPSLPIGDAYFWSPGWPTTEGIFQRTHILPITTFDSGATPVPGEKKIIPKNLADVDLVALKKQMADTMEKAKNDDPKLLKKRIAELEKGIKPAAEVPMGVSAWKEYGKKYGYDEYFKNQNPVKIQKIETPVIGKKALLGIEKAVKQFNTVLTKSRELNAAAQAAAVVTIAAADSLVQEIRKKVPDSQKEIIVNAVNVAKVFSKASEGVPRSGFYSKSPAKLAFEKNPGDPQNAEFSDNTGPEQKILDAIAWANAIGIREPENSIIAFLAGYSNPKSTGYTNPRGTLNAKELIRYPRPGVVVLTEAGLGYAEYPSTPATEADLHIRILNRLTGPQEKILRVLLRERGESVSNEILAQEAKYTNVKSTGYTNPRGQLRSYGLIEYTPEGVKASDFLFLK